MKKLLLILSVFLLFAQAQGQSVIRAQSNARAIVAAGYPEMITDGELSRAVDEVWSVSTGMTISGGKADFDDTNDGGSIRQSDANMAFSVESETNYTFSADITISSGNATFYLASSNGLVFLFTTTNWVNGFNTKDFTTGADIGIGGVRIVARTTSDNPWSIDNISLKKR